MKKQSIKMKLLAGAMITGMLMTTSTAVFADDTDTSTVSTATEISQTMHKHDNIDLSNKLDSLVAEGTLSENSAAAIKEALTSKGDRMNKADDTAKDTAKDASSRSEKIKSNLDSLAEAGTITSDEQSAIENVLSSENANLKTALQSLVDDGTITSERANEIKTALHPNGNKMNKRDDNAQDSVKSDTSHTSKIQSKLDSLVEDGTITAHEETAVLGLFDTAQ